MIDDKNLVELPLNSEIALIRSVSSSQTSENTRAYYQNFNVTFLVTFIPGICESFQKVLKSSNQL